jgi:hypothetical protein
MPIMHKELLAIIPPDCALSLAPQHQLLLLVLLLLYLSLICNVLQS